jgi:CheY-like chemotaxis protein
MPKTLLLADDSVTIQRVIELSFANEDVRVVSVSDGRRAIQWIDTERPDVVVADVGVPEVDGYGIVAHVKKSAELKHIPVVLLAGAFEPVDDQRVKSSGCDGILVKPFEPQQLVSRVKDLIVAAERFAPAARTPAGVGPRLSVVEPGAKTGARAVEAQPERVEMPELTATMPAPFVGTPEPLELPAEPIWHRPLSTSPAPEPAPAAPAKVSLANAFSALLAAEQARPSQMVAGAPPQIPEAAIEEAVRRILARMTGEAVRQVVLDTAERLIREEIEKIKANSE